MTLCEHVHFLVTSFELCGPFQPSVTDGEFHLLGKRQIPTFLSALNRYKTKEQFHLYWISNSSKLRHEREEIQTDFFFVFSWGWEGLVKLIILRFGAPIIKRKVGTIYHTVDLRICDNNKQILESSTDFCFPWAVCCIVQIVCTIQKWASHSIAYKKVPVSILFVLYMKTSKGRI